MIPCEFLSKLPLLSFLTTAFSVSDYQSNSRTKIFHSGLIQSQKANMSAGKDFISADNNTSPSNSFNPSEISRSTFSKLLSCYRTAVREVYRDKLIVKSRPKVTKKARNVSSDGTDDTGALIDEEKMNREIESFLQLDEWRFEKLPKVLRERAQKEWTEDGRTVEESKETEKTASKKKLPGTFLEKEDLVNLMEWKLYVSSLACALIIYRCSLHSKTYSKTATENTAPTAQLSLA